MYQNIAEIRVPATYIKSPEPGGIHLELDPWHLGREDQSASKLLNHSVIKATHLYKLLFHSKL